jgi:hypothetical protein
VEGPPLESEVISTPIKVKKGEVMVVQEKKQGEIRICVNLRKLNDACLHEPLTKPFTNEVLENVGGHKVYSFTDRFSGYHQMKIAHEYIYNTMFSIE